MNARLPLQATALLALALAPISCAPGSARRYLALGDSYTIGEGVAESGRWPVQLAGILRESGREMSDPTIIARTGWTTGDLMKGIDAAGPSGPYDLVTLLIGVNNQYRGRPIDEYREEFRTLLKRSVAFAGGEPGRVLVLSIPDWGVTPYAEGRDRARIAREIERFNDVNKDETRRAGARYVDVTGPSRSAATDRAALVGDGLHPSGKMYEAWARLALPEAEKALDAGGQDGRAEDP
jgi:lysophospholipase L1-like esterase